jgi:arginyl-tRNA synthetase
MNIRDLLNDRVEAAMRKAGIPDDCAAIVVSASRPELGDYQANGAMGAAKRMGVKPRDLAAGIVAALELEGIAESVQVAGPGFINIRLAQGFLEQRLHSAARDERLGIPRKDKPQTIVVDYSGVNLAKEMHVGHLRSTIIGDAVVRALEFSGERVIRQNHVGDWGTQFGMLIAHLEDLSAGGQDGTRVELADLEVFYRAA